MTCSAIHVANQIRERGFRLTPQRMAILNILYASDGHLAPTEIFEQLQPVLSGATEPTVYRNLDFLRENGLIRATHLDSGRLEYEIVTHAHHHLTCKACGQEIEVNHEQLQPLYDQLEQSTGYRLTENHLTFMGLCPHCKEKGE
jgi:Fe2+ or Zn2+ uptake regulation protein